MPRYLSLMVLITAIWLPSLFAQSTAPTGGYGNIRSYVLLEDQGKDYRDYQTWAIGGWLGYGKQLTEELYIDAAFYHTQAVWSTDFTIKDPITDRPSRYALGLYNVQSPGLNRVTILGKLNLQYTPKRHHLTAGRFLAKTPFLNPEDGRMIPTLTQGLRYRYQWENIWLAQFYYIQALAPRSTGRWYLLGNSLGTYSSGLQPDGTPSQYAGHVDTDGLLVGNLKLPLASWASLDLWNYHLTNVFNLIYGTTDHQIWANNQWNIKLSTQWFYQNGIKSDGSGEATFRYIDPDHQSWAIGTRLQTQHDPFTLNLSFLRIGPSGRFLFPREWGREPFFVFQKRERTEGSGDVWAYYSSLTYHKKPFKLKTSYGYQNRPAPTNTKLNKYALGDYHHFDVELTHSWSLPSEMKLALELLYTRKWNGMSDISLKPGWEQNKVNISLYHLVVNLSF